MECWLALYNGSYGNTIRIEIRGRKSLFSLHNMLLNAISNLSMANIHGILDIKYNISELTIFRADKNSIDVKKDGDYYQVLWSATEELLVDCLGLITGILDHSDGNRLLEQHIYVEDWMIELEWHPLS